MHYQNILLIDDDTDDQEIFTSALAIVSEDLTCIALSDAREALHKLEAKTLEPDVIFLDLNMPMMTGMQFLGEIKKRERLSSIPVIIFSTSSNPVTIAETKSLGATDFITKPNKFNDLIDLLKTRIYPQNHLS